MWPYLGNSLAGSLQANSLIINDGGSGGGRGGRGGGGSGGGGRGGGFGQPGLETLYHGAIKRR